MYLPSTQIKMYPSSLRDDAKDRNARLNSEQNIVSVPNRLSDTKSYIINGLNPTPDNTQIQAGECCINGYYFNITSNININNIEGIASSNNIYFKIKLNTTNNFTQLSPQNGGESLDDSNFVGLSVVSQKDSNETDMYYLLILKREDTSKDWYTPEESKLKYYSSSILYNGVDISTPLNNYLNNIYCIDDGEL